jgi:hypothetical protein
MSKAIFVLKDGTKMVQCDLVEEGDVYNVKVVAMDSNTDRIGVITLGTLSRAAVDAMLDSLVDEDEATCAGGGHDIQG